MTVGATASVRHPAPSIVEAMQLPRVVHVRKGLYAAAFELMKLLPARFMVDRAESRGQLRPKAHVIETSSGTFALGLALVCRLRDYRLTVVGDPVIDTALRTRLADLGAAVSIVEQPAAEGGIQQARLDRLAQLQREHPNHFTPDQYHNPDNPTAYGQVAELLLETLGRIDCLVAPVGSGGSSCGTATFLRTVLPDLRLVGVDTHGSALFGMDDHPRLLRGLGNSLNPDNVEHELFDEVHWVGAAPAMRMMRELHSRHGMFMGPTSGAAFMVARWWAARHPDAKVVVLMPDAGHRYQATAYDEGWLRANGLLDETAPAEPQVIDRPRDAAGQWDRLLWGRRSLHEVTGETGGSA